MGEGVLYSSGKSKTASEGMRFSRRLISSPQISYLLVTTALAWQ